MYVCIRTLSKYYGMILKLQFGNNALMKVDTIYSEVWISLIVRAFIRPCCLWYCSISYKRISLHIFENCSWTIKTKLHAMISGVKMLNFWRRIWSQQMIELIPPIKHISGATNYYKWKPFVNTLIRWKNAHVSLPQHIRHNRFIYPLWFAGRQL